MAKRKKRTNKKINKTLHRKHEQIKPHWKPRGELRCSGRVSTSFSTSDTHHVTFNLWKFQSSSLRLLVCLKQNLVGIFLGWSSFTFIFLAQIQNQKGLNSAKHASKLKKKEKRSTLPNILSDYLKHHFRIHMTNGIATYLRNYPLKVMQ